MTESETYLAVYGRYQQTLARVNDLNKTIVFDALAAAGITRVVVEFDGEGDSGQIEGASAYLGDTLLDFPDTKITVHVAQYNKDDLRQSETTLRDAVEELCYDYLRQAHDGWENNDGAYGEFTLDVSDRKITLDFNARFTDSVNFSHTF